MSIRVGVLAAVLSLLLIVVTWAWVPRSSSTPEVRKIVAASPDPQATAAPAPSVSPQTPVPADGTGHPVATDWARLYHGSTDHFELARELAEAALRGDARAEYWLGELLLGCRVQQAMLGPATEGTVAERVERYLATGAAGPRHVAEKFRKETLRCERLFSEDPFDDYELPQEARDFRFWSARAVDSADPRALVDRVFRDAVSRPAESNDEEAAAFRDALLADIRKIVSSRDPAALFVLGGLLSYPGVGLELEEGYAWQVAACELGYDCSLDNPEWGFECVESGSCLPGENFLDSMQRDFGAVKYAEIYSRAQDIKYKVSIDDWDGLQRYLKVK